MARNHIVLVGSMGSGKTTTGTRLAEALSRPFVDSDAQIEAAYGSTGRELAERFGVAWLHEAEAAAFSDALESPDPAVIAAAASIADRPELVAALESEDLFTVLLEADVEVQAQRAGKGHHRRPVDWTDMEDRTAQRRARLAEVVDLEISTTSMDPDAVVTTVLAAFAERR
jgi:shikimate kinase